MKKRFLAFLLSAAIALTSVIGSPFSVLAADEEPREIPECTCTYQPQGIYSHNYGCPYQAFFYGMSDNTLWTAEQIFAMWDEFNEVEQAFILEYLKNNAWQCGDKLDELIILIEGGSTDPEDPELEQQTLSCGPINGVTITVEGMLPEGTAVEASAAQLPDGDMPEDVTILGFDISLSYNGAEYQPEEAVTLSFAGLTLYENPLVGIIHVLDDAQAIQNGIANGNAFASDDADLVALHPEEAALTASVTGESGVVYVEAMSSADGSITISEEGVVRTSASSFSDYYVVSGNTANGSTAADVIYINDNENNTYYIAPGTTIHFQRGRGEDDDTLICYAKRGSGTSSNTHISAKARVREHIPFTIFFRDGDYFELESNYNNNHVGLLDHLRSMIDVVVPGNATAGETYELVTSRATAGLHESTTTIIVMGESDIIDNVLESDTYPVYVSLLQNAASGLPGEPGLTGGARVYASEGMTGVSTVQNTYADNGSGIIDSGIYHNPYFVSAADGTNTMGVVDATGAQTKAVLSGIDWDAFLTKAAQNGTIKASDGTTVTNANKGSYEIVPYVVKLQTAYGIGWHVDCYVKPKASITVTYDVNIPLGCTVDNIALPNSVSAVPPVSMTVGSMSINGTTITTTGNASKVSATNAEGNSVTLTFTGWNTKADGSGTRYAPGTSTGSTAQPNFENDTTLYAIWTSQENTGSLEIRNTVLTDPDSIESAPANAEFAYSVPAAQGKSYKIYASDNSVVRSGTVGSDGSGITLKSGQRATITGVPKGAYLVSQTSQDNYTTSSVGDSGSIVGGLTSAANFVNTYKIPGYTLDYEWTNAPGTVTLPVNSEIYTSETEARAALDTTFASGTTAYGSDGVTPYVFSGWTASDQIGADRVIHVSGSWQQKYIVSVTAGEGITSTSGAGYYLPGESVSLSASPAPGYHVLLWSGPSGTGSAQTYSFTMPSADTAYTVTAEKNRSTLRIDPNGGSWNGTTEVSSLTGAYNTTCSIPVPTRENYDFIGWTLASSVTGDPVNGSMSSLTGAANYSYGKTAAVTDVLTAQWQRKESSLTIGKSGWNAVDSGQSFLFHVTSVGSDPDVTPVDIYVTVQGNGSVTISGLSVGAEYLVEEVSSWSWRYTPAGSVSKTLAADASQNVLTVANTRSGSKWLSSCDCKVNKAE